MLRNRSIARPVWKFCFGSLLAVLAACSAQSGGCACITPPSPGPIAINPQSVSWALGGLPTPAAVSATDTRGFGVPNNGNPLAVIVTSSDPVHIGAWAVQPSPGATSTFIEVLPIGGTQTPVTVSVHDLMGDLGTFTASSGLCGRPDLLNGAQLLYPPNGAMGVAVSTSEIYVSGSEPAGISTPAPNAPPGKLHFVVDGASTIEGGALSYATPPPGSATPAPQADSNTYVGAEPMPALAVNNHYEVYLYDDACEQPFLAGSFST